jgi:hypothetical protein
MGFTEIMQEQTQLDETLARLKQHAEKVQMRLLKLGLEDFIRSIEQLKHAGKTPVSILKQAVDAVYELMEGTLSLDDFNQTATWMQSKSAGQGEKSVGLSVLASALAAVSWIAFALGLVAMFSAPFVPGLILFVSSFFISALSSIVNAFNTPIKHEEEDVNTGWLGNQMQFFSKNFPSGLLPEDMIQPGEFDVVAEEASVHSTHSAHSNHGS